jgi:hypothetical protein
VVRSLAGPALAVGTQVTEISYLAVLLLNGGVYYRMKWNTSDTGLGAPECGTSFSLSPATTKTLMPPSGTVSGSCLSVNAVINATGTITLAFPAGTTLVDFAVKRGQCVAGPGGAGMPSTGLKTGPVTFAVPTSNKAGCV